MDIGRILSRSLEIAWRYKFLWLLGFIMALTGSGGGNPGANNNFRTSVPNGTFPFPSPGRNPFNFPRVDTTWIAAIAILALCFFLLFLVLVFYFRFVARGAMVATVRAAESNSHPTLGSSWREGQGYYGRLLGLGLLVNIPLIILTLLLIAVAVLPFLGSILLLINQAQSGVTNGREVAPVISSVLGFIVLICCALLCLGIIALVVHPIYEFAVRAIVLENTGTMEGLSRGYRRLRENLGSGMMLYIVLIGSRIGWALVTAIIAIPVFLVFFFALVAMFRTNPAGAIILGLVIGIPLSLLFVFIEGLFQVFESNAWTLGYMSLLALPQTPAASVYPTGPTSPPASAPTV